MEYFQMYSQQQNQEIQMLHNHIYDLHPHTKYLKHLRLCEFLLLGYM